MKKLIRLTESDLHRIVKESVDKILKKMNLNPNPRRRAAKSQQNINDEKIDIKALARQLYPDHTAQMAKDELKRKLYGMQQ